MVRPIAGCIGNHMIIGVLMDANSRSLDRRLALLEHYGCWETSFWRDLFSESIHLRVLRLKVGILRLQVSRQLLKLRIRLLQLRLKFSIKFLKVRHCIKVFLFELRYRWRIVKIVWGFDDGDDNRHGLRNGEGEQTNQACLLNGHDSGCTHDAGRHRSHKQDKEGICNVLLETGHFSVCVKPNM